MGSEVLRREVLKRNQETEMMMERAELLRRHKIRYGLYTMVGLPTETLRSALETVKLATRLKGYLIMGHHSIFYPFPGTPLNDLCKAQGLISDRTVGSFYEDTRLDMPAFSREEVVWAHRHFMRFRLAYWMALKLPGRLALWAERKLDRSWMSGGLKARRGSARVEGHE